MLVLMQTLCAPLFPDYDGSFLRLISSDNLIVVPDQFELQPGVDGCAPAIYTRLGTSENLYQILYPIGYNLSIYD